MKKILLPLFALMGSWASAQLNTGDLSFIGFNADGEDDLALVTFVDIPANTVLFVCDEEWDGTAFGDGENDFHWNSGTEVIPAGTVIVFNSIDGTPVANIGTHSGEAGGISATDEGIFVYNATLEAPRVPTSFICAIANDADGYGSLANTGLTEGTTALTLPASTDVALYTGTREGLTQEAFVTSLNNMDNWEMQSGSGDQSADGTSPDLPFDTTAFELGDGEVTPNLPILNLADNVIKVDEDATTASVVITLSAASDTDCTVALHLITDVMTATEEDDFTYTNQTVTIPAGSTSHTVNIPIVEDTDAESDELFMLAISNATNAEIGEDTYVGIYIIDNDTALEYPASPALDINYATSYLVDENGSAEIVAHDPDSQRLFVMNSTVSKVEVLDFSDIENISTLNTIDLSSYGTDGGTSIAVKDGLVAATISNGADADGLVVFMDIDGNNVTAVTVGNLPDMVTFSPDGTKVLTANEGQPNDDYTNDPEGSISVIDVSGGLSAISQANVTNLSFNSFDTEIESLRAAGVRIFGPDASVSEDLEPEYITFAADGNTAWVSLQENNALGVIDLTTNTITDILPLGYKDHSLTENSFDVSNKIDFVFMANWPTMGMYMPDAIASYEVNGVTYIVTANEGDAREYDGYEEEARVKDDEYMLDPTAFPNADYLKQNETLGRIKTTLANGDIDNDGDYDVIYTYGARSFSIWNGTTGAQVFDSGDDFERYTAADATYGALFNTTNDENNFKNRSDDKGPEPEGVTIAEIDGSFYAFITLERMGGMMVYDVTDPANAEFVAYKNHRDLGEDEGGDLGPEGIIYIAPEDSPNGTGLVLMANEVSATVSVYTLDNVTMATEDFTATNNFKLYPNPVKSEQTVFFSEAISGGLYDMTGRQLTTFSNQHQLQLPSLPAGTYILQVANGASKKIVIQ